jgi:hypothetical protein
VRVPGTIRAILRGRRPAGVAVKDVALLSIVRVICGAEFQHDVSAARNGVRPGHAVADN